MPFAALLYLFVRGLLPGGDEDEEGGDSNEPGQGDNAAPELAVDPFLAALNAKNLRPSEYALKLIEAKGLVYTLLAARDGACYVEGRSLLSLSAAAGFVHLLSLQEHTLNDQQVRAVAPLTRCGRRARVPAASGQTARPRSAATACGWVVAAAARLGLTLRSCDLSFAISLAKRDSSLGPPRTPPCLAQRRGPCTSWPT